VWQLFLYAESEQDGHLSLPILPWHRVVPSATFVKLTDITSCSIRIVIARLRRKFLLAPLD